MAFKKTCLLVAPTTDLFYSHKEVEAVVNLLSANLLNGRVEVGDLIERVRKVQPELLIISTHGGPEGILLSDGFIGADLLKPILSTTRVECVYLNTCESLEIAMTIHNELPTSFVASISPVPDKSAYVTMSAFAYHLSQGLDYVDAWFRSKSAGNRSFLFLPSATPSTSTASLPLMTQSVQRDENGKIKDLHDEVERLVIVMYGDDRWNAPGVLPSMMRMRQDIQRILILLGLLLGLGLLLLVAVGVQWLIT